MRAPFDPQAKIIAIDIAFSAVLSCLFAIGGSYVRTQALELDSAFVVDFLSAAFVLSLGFFLARSALGWQGAGVRGRREEGRVRSALRMAFFSEAHPVRSVCALAVVVCLLWLPYALAFAPGNLNFDTTGQMAAFFSLADWGSYYYLTDHHPVFDTLFIGSVVYGVYALTGSAQAGVLAFIALQFACMSLSFATVAYVAVRKWRTPVLLAAGCIAFVGLFPLFPIVACSASKDTVFAWVFLLFALAVAEIARTKGGVLRDRRFLALFAVLCALSILTKKFGLYVVVGTLACMLVLLPKKRFLMTCSLCLISFSLVLSSALTPLLVSSLGGAPGGRQEALSVPIQQTTLAYLRHGSEMSEQDVAAINRLLECDTLPQRYGPWSVDAVKSIAKYRPARTFSEFLEVWAAQGIQHPKTYLDAWAMLDAPLLSGTPFQPIFDTSSHIENNGFLPDEIFLKPEANMAASGVIAERYRELLDLPVLKEVLSLRLWGLVVPAFFVRCTLPACGTRGEDRRQAWALALAPIPLLTLCASLFLGPVTWGTEASRYVIAPLFATPTALMFSRYALTARMPGDTASASDGTMSLSGDAASLPNSPCPFVPAR